MSTPNSTLGHGRHGSAGRGTPQIQRRPTRGPLDLADAPVNNPLWAPTTTALPATPSASSISQHPLSSPLIPGIVSPGLMSPQPRSRGPSPSPPSANAFPQLLRPELYHPLPSTNTPPALLSSPGQTSDLATLLSTSQFRSGAILAAQSLTTSTSPTDTARIFELMYVRLACLTLIGHTTMAAQEVKVLEDLGAEKYYGGEGGGGKNVIPWELRVLAVRLQGIGYGDLRKGIVGYYDLAREARTELAKLGEKSNWVEEHRRAEKRTWEDRLGDLGVRVAGALVEMGDREGAAVHLATLTPLFSPPSDPEENEGRGERASAFRLALLWLKIGDVDKARSIIKNTSYQSGEEEFVILALANMADGKYPAASEVWRRLIEGVDREGKWTGEEMWRVNLGVCLLYCGRIGEGRQLMEGVVEEGNAFNALTFNLSTIYELSTDRSRVLKSQLVDRVAALSIEGKSGWEGTNADFKL